MAKALIIGAGIAGSVTAVALHKAGIEAAVFEAAEQSADGIGAYLTLSVNGLAALETLDLKPTLYGGFDTPRMVVSSATGGWRMELSTGRPLPDGTVTRTIRRSDLYAALRNEAVHRGVPVEYGKRLVDAEMRRTGTVVARFADGTEAEGDLLVGADGLQSRTRTVIDPDAPAVRYTGLLSTAGYASDVEAPGETGVMHLIFGKRCFFGYVKNPVGEIWWFANPPQPTELTRAELAATTSEQWRERLLQLFADDRTVAVDVIRSTDEILGGWSNYDFPTVPTWHNDRMVIVGDAAHAASPSSGQGAAMAVEDAVVLAKCLRDLPDPAAAFAAYEGLRRSRVEAVVAQGRRRGQQKAAGLVGRFVRDRVIMPMVAQRVARLPEDPNSWMYDYRIEWDAPALVS